MRTYLRIFNPLIALLIFILCSFAAVKEDKNKPIVPGNIIAGGIPTYFFAKGMFCGVALLLLGKILENQLVTNPKKKVSDEDGVNIWICDTRTLTHSELKSWSAESAFA